MKQWMSRMLVGVLAIALSGCVASQTETTITSDGSGTNTFKVGFEESALAMMQSMGGSEMSDPFADVKESTSAYPAEWGATTTDWQETLNGQAFKGVKVDMKFANVAMLNEQLGKFMTDSGGEQNPTGQALSNLKVAEDGETFTVSGNAVATDLAAAAESEGGSEMAGMPGMENLSKAVIVWQVTLPGEITESGPEEITTVNGNTVTWKIPADKAATYSLKAVASKSGGGSSLPLILGGVGLLVVLAGVGFFVMSRRKAAPVAAGYQQYGGQTYDPNAQGQNQQQGYYDPNNDPNRKQ